MDDLRMGMVTKPINYEVPTKRKGESGNPTK